MHICRVADLLRIPDATPIPNPSVVLRTPRQEEAFGVASSSLVRRQAIMTIYKGVSSLFGLALRFTPNAIKYKRRRYLYAVHEVWTSKEGFYDVWLNVLMLPLKLHGPPWSRVRRGECVDYTCCTGCHLHLLASLPAALEHWPSQDETRMRKWP